jgi:hypothetical protein
MPVRTQIALEAQDHRRAKQRAAELNVSLAEYIRRLVARDLGEPTPRAEVATVFDLFDSGGTDVARHKDRLLAEAMEAERARGRGGAPSAA